MVCYRILSVFVCSAGLRKKYWTTFQETLREVVVQDQKESIPFWTRTESRGRTGVSQGVIHGS